MNAMKRTCAVLLLASAPTWAHAQATSTKRTLSLEGAKKAIAAAVAEATKAGATGVIAVVDDGGNLMALERIDGTFAAGANISIGKARTAALFKKPTKVFEDIVNQGRTTMVALPDFTPLQGGVPIQIDGQVVGAIGVSGAASAQQDEELALAGAAAAESFGTAAAATGSAAVTYMEGSKVSAAFVKGAPLVEVDGYKVHASRREAPGMAEVHALDTDIIYVLEGTATVVTGGTVVDSKTTAPNEIRGSSIQNGRSQRLAKGDLMIVPNGTPHWFEAASNPFLYYVVKVTAR